MRPSPLLIVAGLVTALGGAGQTGYRVYRAAVRGRRPRRLDSLNAQKSVLVGSSCAGQILTLFASQHSDRLPGLVYLDGANDPTIPAHDPPMPDPATLPRRARPAPEPDLSSFVAFTRRRDLNVAFPEAEWHQFAANADGSGRGVLLLALTGYGSLEDAKRSSEHGFDHHLVKPVDPTRLASLIDARAEVEP